jgi:hypothetical protein
MMARTVTGTIYNFDGDPWAGARLYFFLLTDPATGEDALWPRKTIRVVADSNGAFTTSLDTPPSGSWKYGLVIENNTALEFYLEQGDGSALSISDLVTLAGLAGNEAGTPAANWLVATYDGFVAAADGDGLVKSAGEPAWAAGAGGGISDAPSDGNTYARLNAAWSSITTALTNAREWTADIVPEAEAQAGTATTRRAWTAQRVAQAIAALVSVAWTELTGTLTLAS